MSKPLTEEQTNIIAKHSTDASQKYFNDLRAVLDLAGLDKQQAGEAMITVMEGFFAFIIGAGTTDVVDVYDMLKGVEKRLIDQACRIQSIIYPYKGIA